MKTDGQAFLTELASSPPNTFEGRFCRISTRLRLGAALNWDELSLLHQEAAFLAALCNIALNGLGGCRGKITSENEPARTGLEQKFMAVRERFFASRGWKNLPPSDQETIQRIFLNVLVSDENLAW